LLKLYVVIQVVHERERLLRHPTVTSLMNRKWWKFGRYIYWANLLSYITYMVVLNVYMTTTPPRFAINRTATEAHAKRKSKCLV